jgi:hypothetical protein
LSLYTENNWQISNKCALFCERWVKIGKRRS